MRTIWAKVWPFRWRPSKSSSSRQGKGRLSHRPYLDCSKNAHGLQDTTSIIYHSRESKKSTLSAADHFSKQRLINMVQYLVLSVWKRRACSSLLVLSIDHHPRSLQPNIGWILSPCRKAKCLINKPWHIQAVVICKSCDNIPILHNPSFKIPGPCWQRWLHEDKEILWTMMEEATTIFCLGQKSQLLATTGLREAKHDP